jgi:hypothetical protein
MQVAQPLGVPPLVADILFALGQCYAMKGNGRKATSYKLRALRVAEGAESLRKQVAINLALATDAWDLGDLRSARAYSMAAAEAALQSGDLPSQEKANLIRSALDILLPEAPGEAPGGESPAVAPGPEPLEALHLLRNGVLGQGIEALLGAASSLEAVGMRGGAARWLGSGAELLLSRREVDSARALAARAIPMARNAGEGLLVQRLEFLIDRTGRPGRREGSDAPLADG